MTAGRDARRIRPPPVSRHPGSVSGPYFGESKFPLVPPLRSTDSAESSPSLFARFITTMDESDCFLSPLMDYGFLLSHKAPARAGERASPPRSRDKICVRAWVLGLRRAWLALTTAVQPVLPSTGTTVSALPSKEFFDAHWPRPHAPLPTLRRRPHGRPRTARGETWMVSPSFQRTFTAYLVPVSLAHCPPHLSAASLFPTINRVCMGNRKSPPFRLMFKASRNDPGAFCRRARISASASDPEDPISHHLCTVVP